MLGSALLFSQPSDFSALMADRYYVETPIEGSQARLLGAEAHHLAHVMRAKPGVEVTLFDGRGAEFLARVEKVGRSEIELAILSCQQIDRELDVSITLAVALPKGDRQRWLAEKVVELGVARLTPLQTERGNDRETPAGLDRLRRVVVEASKQSGRNRLMEISGPVKLADFFSTHPGGASRWLAHPGAKDCRAVFAALQSLGQTPGEMLFAIGPEGGFSDAEVELAVAQGWQTIGLGERILRVETAAVALASAAMILLKKP